MHFIRFSLDSEEKKYLRSLKPTAWSEYCTLSLGKKVSAFVLPEIENVALLRKLLSLAIECDEREIYEILIKQYSKEEVIRLIIKIRFNYIFKATTLCQRDWELIQDCKKYMPYFLYLSSSGGDNFKSQHPEMHGLILPVDHPFWDTHAPPWYWEDCDQIVQIPSKKVKPYGIDISKISEGIIIRDGVEYDVRSPIEKGEPGPVCIKFLKKEKSYKKTSKETIKQKKVEPTPETASSDGCYYAIIAIILFILVAYFLF